QTHTWDISFTYLQPLGELIVLETDSHLDDFERSSGQASHIFDEAPPTEVYSHEDKDYYRKTDEHSLYHSTLLYSNGRGI
ncbi:MAG: hypothetical protein KAJ09_02840, partial [Deltaproteobacteria bacterium]|nr:hypothetical protein [Deltaproteobacteria bacterium]